MIGYLLLKSLGKIIAEDLGLTNLFHISKRISFRTVTTFTYTVKSDVSHPVENHGDFVRGSFLHSVGNVNNVFHPFEDILLLYLLSKITHLIRVEADQLIAYNLYDSSMLINAIQNRRNIQRLSVKFVRLV